MKRFIKVGAMAGVAVMGGRTMKKKSTVVVALLVGMIIGLGIPPRYHLQNTLETLLFSTALAQGEGEGEEEAQPCECSFLTVTGPTYLNSDVTIGSEVDPVGDLQVSAQGIEMHSKGLAANQYDGGYVSVYGHPDTSTGAALVALPGPEEVDPTSYQMNFYSTGFFTAKAGTAAFAAGDYVDEGGAYTGTYLIGLDSEDTARSAVHLASTEDNNGTADLGAIRSDGSTSWVKIDAAGNIVVVLGEEPVQDTQSSQQQGARVQQDLETDSAVPETTGPQYGLGRPFPTPDIASLVQQFGGNTGAQP
jgi:hypothetical protein